jgi:hypothetical protein
VLLLQQISFNLPKFLNRTSLFFISNHQQVAVGGRTQLTSVVSIGILFVVIYAAGALFTYLPKVMAFYLAISLHL